MRSFHLIYTIFGNRHPSKTGTVSGLVYDASLNEPLPYVSVVLSNPKGETITGTITNEKDF